MAGHGPESVVHEFEQGMQLASIAFAVACRAVGDDAPMGSVGGAHHKAVAESFIASLETELLAAHGVRGAGETRVALFR